MNGVSESPRNSYIGIKTVSKTPERMLSLVKVDVTSSPPCSVVHYMYFIVLGLNNALYTRFVWKFTRCFTIDVSNDGQNLNVMQIIEFSW